ncbi:WXG100 family type VII secretion target [Kitasatospora sp. NBC_01250]|uniref:WXG100 family type VII secretion target n=1 Tax=Kitasatospora sp. NBC_01250 TaxID=2903571 RepID=UPI002E362F7C|nr:WXG100 family type VII secretion target [Kitasatospora sp. NBC_01250]
MSFNGAIDHKVLEVLQACGVELPGGDGDQLRKMAAAWDAMGDELTGLATGIDLAIEGLDQKDWSGAARAAFGQAWAAQKKVIQDVAGNFHQVAAGLREYADTIDSINEQIIDIGVQIAEMEVAGAALSLFTGFLSDLLANAAVVSKVAKITDLVKAFTTAAEKVAALIAKFTGMAEKYAQLLEKMLVFVAKFGAAFLKKGGEAFVTNFVADTGAMALNQAATGQKVDLTGDMTTGSREALGTAVVTGLGAGLAPSASGKLADILSGDGRLGTTVNGALGNVSGGLTADLWGGATGSQDWQDALTNAATGGLGNATNHEVFNALEEKGLLGGENLSYRATLRETGAKDGYSTGLNTAIYAAGGGIESDVQTLSKIEAGLKDMPKINLPPAEQPTG